MKEQKNTEQIEINEQFQLAYDLLEGTDRSVFITGRAGTGKSTFLNYFREKTKKRVAVLAPTGVSALNVKGQTIHSFFGFPLNLTMENALDKKLSQKKRELIENLDMIIIDESSMLRADMLDCIDMALRFYRGDGFTPFGDTQMVFIGDLFQLPPVVASREERSLFQGGFGGGYESPYFFSARVFNDVNVHTVEFQEIYRQKDNDFIELLNKIRDNTAGLQDLEVLNTRQNREHQGIGITLTTTNRAADMINDQHLEKLKGKSFTFSAEIDGELSEKHMPTASEIYLKPGAQIMMLNNDGVGRWVNGTLGQVSEIDFDMMEGEEILVVKLEDGKSVKVKKHLWEVHQYTFDEEKGRLDTEVVGSFRQFPVRLAWAVTIHKSQGKTFENVVIDLGRGTFAHGQLYVALSRCTSLEGIVLKTPIQKRHIIMDHRVQRFMDRI